ncbi:MAG: hypothetical protein EKK48_19080 [Candidatus Melainabacteria bacterium]|nr:MAG: hypothetical protein EKK48_19080 [Candidatus Melainabacteria bacterium]
MKKDTDPIALTGKVYVAAYLAPYYPRYKLPDQLQRGDIKIDCHLDEQGRANRAGKTRKCRLRGYSGFFTGVVYDGESWRKFDIAAIVGSSVRYSNQSTKAEKIPRVLSQLEAKAGLIAVYGIGSYLLGQ